MLSMPTGLLVLALLGQAAGFAEIPKGAAETLRESRTAASRVVLICIYGGDSACKIVVDCELSQYDYFQVVL